jgi:hypothetical protein
LCLISFPEFINTTLFIQSIISYCDRLLLPLPSFSQLQTNQGVRNYTVDKKYYKLVVVNFYTLKKHHIVQVICVGVKFYILYKSSKMDILPSVGILYELSCIHETGYLLSQASPEDYWHQVNLVYPIFAICSLSLVPDAQSHKTINTLTPCM